MNPQITSLITVLAPSVLQGTTQCHTFADTLRPSVSEKQVPAEALTLALLDAGLPLQMVEVITLRVYNSIPTTTAASASSSSAMESQEPFVIFHDPTSANLICGDCFSNPDAASKHPACVQVSRWRSQFFSHLVLLIPCHPSNS